VLFTFSLEDCTGDHASVQNDRVNELSAQLKSIMEQKYLEGLTTAKKGKDKSPIEGKLEVGGIDAAFCSGLPSQTILQCIALQIVLDPTCLKKGYVVDAWEKDVFDNATELSDCVNSLLKQSIESPFDIAVYNEVCRIQQLFVFLVQN
jgi:hypothetical protein